VEKIKLAFLAPEFLPTWGGIGAYSFELLRNLEDIDVHLITPYRGYSAKQIQKALDRKVNVHFLSIAKDNFFYNLKFQLALAKDFMNLHKKHNFDLVHAANLVNMPDVFLKLKNHGIPTVTTVHTTLKSQSTSYAHKPKKEGIELATKIASPYIGLLEKYYLKKSDNLIAVSDWISGFVPSATVINNGVDTARFAPVPKSNEKPIVLFTGRLVALKGIETLVEAMKLASDVCDVRFVVAGTGSNDHSLLGVDCSFTGYVPHERIHELYNQADIFVLPSYTESFPLTVLEAMASGLAVVASDVGGIPEIIEDNKDGMLVKAGDATQLAASIVMLVQNKRLRKDLGVAARKKVVDNFSSALMAKRTMDYYRGMLNA